ncbi:CNNM domain-containing protein [Thalassotalea crassostreae]|uniref:CNNM domain-containing protein n=1 Tax=Thalassotalea crassostreae TaxID=1763536 RepID=UPI000837B64B|nr:CNNM domain-containing protein [Thalassotalea crassostreae]
MTLLIVYLSIAIGISFICSVLEAVLLSISPSFIAQVQNKKSRGSEVLAKVKNNLDQSISSILILNTFAHTMGAAGVGAQAIRVFGEKWETLIAFLLTLAILYLSEIIPKTIGANFWRQLAIPSAYIINFLVKIVFPLVWLSTRLTKLFSSKSGNETSREEVLAVASLSYKDGALVSSENQLVGNILKLRDAKTEDILTPRSVVHALDQETIVKTALNSERTANFTRIPIYEGSIDNITGVIIKSELYEQERQGNGEAALKDIASNLYRISENFPVLNLLDVFIKRQEHMFLVEDQFGQTAGIVTLEDAIETILGREIVDESDKVADMQKLAKANYRKRLRENSNKLSNDDS